MYEPADSLASPRFTGPRTFARLPHVQRSRGRRRRPVRHAVGRRDVVPLGRALRARGRAQRLGDAPHVQPGAGRDGVRQPVVHRLRRRVDRARLRRRHARPHRGVRPPDRRGGRHPGRHRRRPLRHAGRAAGGRQGARPARARAPRLARRHLGELLRPAVQPRHAVPARARGGSDRPGPLAAGRDARLAVRRRTTWRCTRSSASRCSPWRELARLRARRSTPTASARGSAPARRSSRSTSTSSTRPTRPATGTPEVGGPTVVPGAGARSRASRASTSAASTWSRSHPTYDGPGQATSLIAANVIFEMLSLIAFSADKGPSGPLRPGGSRLYGDCGDESGYCCARWRSAWCCLAWLRLRSISTNRLRRPPAPVASWTQDTGVGPYDVFRGDALCSDGADRIRASCCQPR